MNIITHKVGDIVLYGNQKAEVVEVLGRTINIRFPISNITLHLFHSDVKSYVHEERKRKNKMIDEIK